MEGVTAAACLAWVPVAARAPAARVPAGRADRKVRRRMGGLLEQPGLIKSASGASYKLRRKEKGRVPFGTRP
ncbi:hypothetical protein GCM10010203_60220 [Actinomadura yumaensis]